jgi:transposase
MPPDLDKCSKTTLKSLVVEQSQLIIVAERMIKKLETQVGRLSMELGSQNQQVLITAEALERMRQSVFGRKSERRPVDDAPLFSKIGDDAAEDVKPHKPRRRRQEFGRTRQLGLAIQDVHDKYADEDIAKHGLKEWAGQYETSELITVVPSRIILQRHHRHKYFRTDPATGLVDIITAPGPVKLKEKSRYSLELAVETGLSKYMWHLPLDRQVRMMSSHGLEVTSQVLFDQVDTVAWYLMPTVFKGIVAEIEKSYVNIADDTTWKNLEKIDEREKERFYLWAVTNKRAVCFNIFDSRSQGVARNFLGKLSGVLVSDGHASFKALASDKLIFANDWYHFRRKLLTAERTFPEEAGFLVAQIRELSHIEDRLAGKPPDEVYAVRQSESKKIVEAIRAKMDELADVLPLSSMGRAITYARKLWSGLTVFLTDPLVPMHSNDIERILRNPAVGRKNHYGSKSLETAKVAAVWYAVVETCKLNDVDPREYLVATLKAILTKKPYKMPWEWHSAPADVIPI